ncbi:hypothetical protein OG563_30405 [Nocardia vinacea]|uniref:Methyltransferase type 11 domain-containing protein n=1 Tax=Nocardia vinacea TaxID=96468 RepID=A0ABZ1YJV7_9NOCA|nr:hypothetical protein [Nocardia vinacea]
MLEPLHFHAHTEVYDRAADPAALWQRLHDAGLLCRGTQVVELGAGTGLATGPMLQTGAIVTAVEPGPALAVRLRRRWPEGTSTALRPRRYRRPPSISHRSSDGTRGFLLPHVSFSTDADLTEG